jgi:hypothetical protein
MNSCIVTIHRRPCPCPLSKMYGSSLAEQGLLLVSRRHTLGNAHVESDVDILKEHECSGEPMDLRESELTFLYSWLLLSNTLQTLLRPVESLMCIWQGPCPSRSSSFMPFSLWKFSLSGSSRLLYSMMALNGSILSPKL